MTSKKRILLDMDGVLVDSLPTWLQAYRELSGDPLYTCDIKTYNFGQYAKNPDLLFKSLHLGDVFRKSPPLPGAVQAFKWLNEHYDVFIASYVHKACPNGHEQKLDWLQHYAPFFDTDKCAFGRAKHLLSADILIEDNPENIEAWLLENPKGIEYLIRHPYNKASDLYPVKDLFEVIKDLSEVRYV